MHLILIIILEARNINYYNNIHKDKKKKKKKGILDEGQINVE